MNPGQRLCGAKTRAGHPCKDIAMKNGRCKRHGGKATGPKTANTKAATVAATKHNIYSQFLSPEDRAIYDAVDMGNIDAELKLVRMRLARCVKARRAWEESLKTDANPLGSDGAESHILVEQVDDESLFEGSPVSTTKKTFRLPDFDKIEHSLLARIESLERTRKDLLKGDGEQEDGADVIIHGGLPDDDA